MKQAKALSLNDLGHAIAKFLWRYHVMLYTLTILIGMGAAIYLLTGVIFITPNSRTQQPHDSQFDQKTIKLIEGFNSAGSGQDSFTLPPGRTNPFAE